MERAVIKSSVLWGRSGELVGERRRIADRGREDSSQGDGVGHHNLVALDREAGCQRTPADHDHVQGAELDALDGKRLTLGVGSGASAPIGPLSVVVARMLGQSQKLGMSVSSRDGRELIRESEAPATSG